MNTGNALMIILSFVTFSFTEETLTLKKVIDLSIRQGIAPASSQIQKEQKSLSVKDKRSAFYPELSTSLSSGANGALNSSQWRSSVKASAGVSYSFNPSADAAYKSSLAQERAAQYQYDQSINKIAADAVTNYIKTLYAQKKIAVAKNNLDYQKTKLAQIEEYRNAGKKSIADVLQQQTAVAEGEASMLDAEQEQGRAFLSLLNILGMNLDSSIQLDTGELSELVPILTSADTSFSIDSLPSILSQQFTIKSGELTLKENRLAYAPSINGSASVGQSYSGIIGDDHDFSDPDGSVSISLTYPIFDRNKRKLNIASQILNIKSAVLSLREIEQDAAFEHKQSLYDLDNARKRLGVAETRLAAAKQSLDATTQRYEAGASTLVEVAMVNNSYLSAVNSRLEAQSSILTASIALLQENGKIINFFDKIYK